METKWWPQGQRDSELCQPLVSLIGTPMACPSSGSVSLLLLLTVSIKTNCLSLIENLFVNLLKISILLKYVYLIVYWHKMWWGLLGWWQSSCQPSPLCLFKVSVWSTAKPSQHLTSVYWWMSSIETFQPITLKSQHNSENKRLFSTHSLRAVKRHQVFPDVGDHCTKDPWHWLSCILSLFESCSAGTWPHTVATLGA